MYPSHILFKLLTFQIIASAFRPHLGFTTSRLAGIPLARRKEQQGEPEPRNTYEGEEKEPAAAGGRSCAPVPRLSVPQRAASPAVWAGSA